MTLGSRTLFYKEKYFQFLTRCKADKMRGLNFSFNFETFGCVVVTQNIIVNEEGQ